MNKIIKIYNNGIFAGFLEELDQGKKYRFKYNTGYKSDPISLTMPVEKNIYDFTCIPPFFDGLLPEELRLQQLLKIKKLDRNDILSLLIAIGKNLKGTLEAEVNE
jgi:HipA-like protein